MLDKHPDVMSQVKQEMMSTFGTRSKSLEEQNLGMYIPTYEELQQFEYLTWVLKETLR